MDVNNSPKSNNDFSDRSRCSSFRLASDTHSSTCFASSGVSSRFTPAGRNCSSATFLTAANDDLCRSNLVNSNSFLSADSAIATPSTNPTSSSSLMSVSCAASSNSEATWNETETDRSLPIDVSAPSDVPPAPTSCCPDISQLDARKAAQVAYELLRPSLLWQTRSNTPALLVQRLWLERFETASRPQGERKRIRQSDTLQSIGTTFGTTLGQILAHVARPQEPHTRLLRAIRDELLKIADHHTKMGGDDAHLLGYGLASCSVIRNERRKLRGVSARIDTRYGNGAAAIGACAAVIATHAVLARFESTAPDYFMETHSLRTTLRVAEERLGQWNTRLQFDYTDREALNAERRALRRARIAVDVAMARAEREVGAATDQLQAQIATATMAAYPPQRVGSHNQAEMETLARGGAFIPERFPSARTGAAHPDTQQTVVVPLSGLPGVPTNTATGGVSETDSVSWVTNTSSGQSDTSSEFEVVWHRTV